VTLEVEQLAKLEPGVYVLRVKGLTLDTAKRFTEFDLGLEAHGVKIIVVGSDCEFLGSRVVSS
jgi:hypothetical protein